MGYSDIQNTEIEFAKQHNFQLQRGISARHFDFFRVFLKMGAAEPV
jgi:hypothetical protein